MSAQAREQRSSTTCLVAGEGARRRDLGGVAAAQQAVDAWGGGEGDGRRRAAWLRGQGGGVHGARPWRCGSAAATRGHEPPDQEEQREGRGDARPSGAGDSAGRRGHASIVEEPAVKCPLLKEPAGKRQGAVASLKSHDAAGRRARAGAHLTLPKSLCSLAYRGGRARLRGVEFVAGAEKEERGRAEVTLRQPEKEGARQGCRRLGQSRSCGCSTSPQGRACDKFDRRRSEKAEVFSFYLFLIERRIGGEDPTDW